MARIESRKDSRNTSTMGAFRGLSFVVLLALLLAASSSNAAPALDRRTPAVDNAPIHDAILMAPRGAMVDGSLDKRDDASEAWAEQSSFFVSISSAMKTETRKLASMTKRTEPTAMPMRMVLRDDTNEGTSTDFDSSAVLTTTTAADSPSATATEDDGDASSGSEPATSASAAYATATANDDGNDSSATDASGAEASPTGGVAVTAAMPQVVPLATGGPAPSIAAMNATATTTATSGAATAIPSAANATHHDGKHRVPPFNGTSIHHHHNHTASVSHSYHANHTSTSHSHHHTHKATQSPTTSLPMFTSTPTTFTLGLSYSDQPASSTKHHHKHHHSSSTGKKAPAYTTQITPTAATSSPAVGTQAAAQALVPSGYHAITILVPGVDMVAQSTSAKSASPTQSAMVNKIQHQRRGNAFEDVDGKSFSASEAAASSSSSSATKTFSSKASATTTSAARKLDADTSNNVDTPPLLRGSATVAATTSSAKATATVTTITYTSSDCDDDDSSSASRRALAELDGMI